jgi:hypothetical protein
MLHARWNELPRVAGSVLLIICSYRGGVGRGAPRSIAATYPGLGLVGRVLDLLSLLPLRRFVAENRDFFANPRDMAYQAGLGRDLLALGTPTEVVWRIDAAYKDPPSVSQIGTLGRIELSSADELSRNADRFDTVALIYGDALGLGWSRLEARLRALRSRNVIFVNGRRRVMTLDASAWRALGWRRFLANTRLPELFFAALALPVAAGCAAADAVRSRR